MKVKMFLTPATNVVDSKLVNDKIIYYREYDWEDKIPYQFKASNDVLEIKVKKISSYDHYLVVRNIKFQIVRVYSRNEMGKHEGKIQPLSMFFDHHQNRLNAVHSEERA